MRRHIAGIDPETGEILGRMVFVPYRIQFSERWFMAFQDSFEEIAKDPDMTGESFRVLTYLYSKLDFENFIQQSQKDVADGLGIQKQRVSRAMRLLISKQIVLEGPKIGRSRCYRLNPNYGWKGKVKTLQEARREHLKVVHNEMIDAAKKKTELEVSKALDRKDEDKGGE